ncbi:MAG TPA: glycosyltransferase [Longimicrobiaceae bacterium]|nr:glycosyltransferase [Longimicrobiaceae bacterium]
MKVTFIINDLSGGGAEKALKLLSGYLGIEGVEAHVLTLESGNDEYALDEGIKRRSLRTDSGGSAIARILRLPLQAAQIARVLREWEADVCVSFLPRSNIAHVMTRWFGNRRPVLITEQISSRDNYPSDSVGDRLMRSLIRRFYPRADAVFPSSEGVMNGLKEFGVPAERMHVVHNPISIRDIRASAREPVPDFGPPGMPTIITVGRHAEQKDHATLLRAFALVQRRIEARLVFLGQGPLRVELEALARELRIEDSVVFAGWQSNPFAWIARADLFVLSSRYEGFGNVIVEAMACGLPIVSTDCPSGPSEILEGGGAGLLVPVGNVDAIARAICSVLEEPETRERLIRESLRRAPDFDLSVIGPRYAKLLYSFSGRRAAAHV